jgi:hypothetical protein
VNKPTVTPLQTDNPQDLIAWAAATCYNRTALRDPERERQMVRKLVADQHLTTLEHVRFIWRAAHLSNIVTTLLLSLPRPINVYESRSGYLVSGNLSQARQAALIDHRLTSLVDTVRQIVPDATDDVPPGDPNNQVKLTLVDVADLTREARWLVDSRSFVVTCSRAAAGQINRHRTIARAGSDELIGARDDADDLSIEEQSQRYVDQTNAHFIWPPSWWERYGQNLLQEWGYHFRFHYHICRKIGGDLKQDARAVLPNAITTCLMLTAPLGKHPMSDVLDQGWYHWLKLRLHKSAQPEIRYVAYLIWRELAGEFGGPFADLEPCLDGLDPWLED